MQLEWESVPRISPVLGRTVSGSTFRWHLSHLILDLFMLLVETSIRKPSFPRTGLIRGTPENPSVHTYTAYGCVCVCGWISLDRDWRNGRERGEEEGNIFLRELHVDHWTFMFSSTFFTTNYFIFQLRYNNYYSGVN